MIKYSIIITIVVLLGVIVHRYEANAKRRKLEETFSGRDPLDANSFYEKYFLDQGVSREIAVGVREIMQQTLDADLSRLNTSDDFSKNLKFFWEFDSLADVQLVAGLEKRFSINISDQEAGRLLTVNDIVIFVDHKVKSKGAS